MEFEGSQPAAGSGRLGLVLSSAHVTIGMRTAVGLPGVAGLLVRSVQPDSPAARADLQPGDVLIKAGGRDLRSSASLYTAVRAAGTSPVQLTVLRGNDQFQTSLKLSGPVDGRSAAARGPGRAGPGRAGPPSTPSSGLHRRNRGRLPGPSGCRAAYPTPRSRRRALFTGNVHPIRAAQPSRSGAVAQPVRAADS